MNKLIFSCTICNTKFSRLENHKKHLETREHKNMKIIKMIELLNLDWKELKKKYGTSDIIKILNYIN